MSNTRRKRGNPTTDAVSQFATGEVEQVDGDIFDFGSSDKKSLEEMTATDIANIGYSSDVDVKKDINQMSSREKITYRSIESIHPNRTQPRRVIPSTLRHFFKSPAADEMARGLEHWLKEIEVERRSPFPLDDYLASHNTKRSEGFEKEEDKLEQIGTAAKPKPLEAAFLKVVELAASIRRDGLTNPITIARKGRDYEIETGERRWLAYHLLNWYYPQEDWSKIQTRDIRERVNIWRQADENNIRADLNAISMARQLALLLMDIREDDDFQQFDNFGDDEQAFYAQVADGNTYRVPRNHGEKLLNAMNLENPVQIRQYRALLRLPREVWQWADDLNWTEGFIRTEIIGKAKDDEDKIRLAYKQTKAEGYTVTPDTVYEELLRSSEPKSKSTKSKYTYKQFESTLGEKVHTFITKLSGKDRDKAIDYLRGMLEDLESNAQSSQ